MHLPALTSLVSEDQPDKSKAEEFICSLYGMKGYVRDVNRARHVKLFQMTGKMDMVLVSLGCFYWGREIHRHHWIWGVYSSIMVKCYMHQTGYPQREVFEKSNFFF